MRRVTSLPAVLALSALLLVGCNSKNNPSTSSQAQNPAVGSSQPASQPTSAGAGASDSPTTAAGAAGTDAAGCPTSNTTGFAKTKFVAHTGAAFGTFHRYIYKPLRAGGFSKGSPGRVRAFLKASATALFDKREIRLAIIDVKANPTLCKVLAAPLANLSDKLGAIGTKIKHGDTSGVQDANTAIASVESQASAKGDPIQENPNANTNAA